MNAAAASGTDGIYASNTGTGTTSVTATGQVTGNTQQGIEIKNVATSTGDVTVNAAAVTGATRAIDADNNGTGALNITATGTVTSSGNDGIVANTAATGTSLSVSAADVSGLFTAIDARNYGSGTLDVTSTGSLNGAGVEGIYAKNSSAGTNTTISVLNAAGAGRGIYAFSGSSGTLSVTVNGTVTGGTGAAISTATGSGTTNIILNSGADVSSTSGTAITNNETNSTVTVNAGATVTGTISLGGGTDVFNGAAASGAFTVNGEGGDDSLKGGSGNDTLNGGTGINILIGGAGADALIGSNSTAAGDVDFADYRDATSGLTANYGDGDGLPTNQVEVVGDISVGTDTLTDVEAIIGSNFADTFNVTSQFAPDGVSFHSIEGAGGNDTITGNGNTTVVFSNASAGVNASLLGGFTRDAADATNGTTLDLANIGTDFLTNVQNLGGSNFDDVLTGNAQANTIDGEAGNDTIDGSNGADTLIGGAGNDTLSGGNDDDTLDGGTDDDTLTGGLGVDSMTGGAGSDTFSFGSQGEGTSAQSNGTIDALGLLIDSVTDFLSGTDSVNITDTNFDLAGGTTVTAGIDFEIIGSSFDGTNATSSRFAAGQGTLILDSDGRLISDTNGSAAGYTVVADFGGANAVAATDITIAAGGPS